MRRSDIYLIDFETVRGAEANKARPAVIVSNDAAGRTVQRLGRGVVTVVPLTSNVSRVFAFQVLLPGGECGLPKDSKAQCEQVRAVAVERVLRRIGAVPAVLMTEVDTALRRHLAL
ncbi:type II toxin-antitoxin system PemK/MazF family toxin [Streptomyces niveus]|uniref:type II toxin-antitoxin system PemK/MazF family toxin n=1 Tax=Streptomyces niveus TaxID=193462 RepID=UPI0035E38414